MVTTTFMEVISKLKITFSHFGFPHQLVTDNGPPLASVEINVFCQRNGSPPYVPQVNGTAERAVQTIQKSLKKTLGEDKRFTIV